MNVQPDGRLYRVLGAALTALAVNTLPVQAGVVGTDEVLASQQSASERERIKALMERSDVARQLEALGIAPDHAKARVDAMTDAEVQTLAGKIDTLPAGGALTTYELILVLLVIILVVLLI